MEINPDPAFELVKAHKLKQQAAARYEKEAAEAKVAMETARKEAADVDHARAALWQAEADLARLLAAGNAKPAVAAAKEAVRLAKETLQLELNEAEEAKIIALRERAEAEVRELG